MSPTEQTKTQDEQHPEDQTGQTAAQDDDQDQGRAAAEQDADTTRTPDADHQTEDQDDDADQDETDHSRSRNREAAKWRTRLREVEAERDALADRVGKLETRDAVRDYLGSRAFHGLNAHLLQRFANERIDEIKPAGTDRADVAEAVNFFLYKNRAELSRSYPGAFPDDSLGGTGGHTPGSEPTWAEALQHSRNA